MSHWPVIEFPDVELWATGWLRPQLADWSPFVSNQLTTHTKAFAVIVRDDSGPDGLVTAERRVGVRVIGTDKVRTGALARRVAALLRGAALPETPVAAVGSIRGPYRVDSPDSTTVEWYLTAELTVVGHQLT